MEHLVKVTTTGSAGSATGSGTTEDVVRGFLEAVVVDYHASAPATTDLTVTEASDPARTLLTLTDQKTDRAVYPRVQVHGTDGVALTTDGTRIAQTRFYVSGVKLTVALAGCDALTDAVVVRILVSEI